MAVVMNGTGGDWAGLASIPILLLLLRRALRAWGDPVEFERQVASMQSFTYITHERARGRVSLMWMTMSGPLISFVVWAPVSIEEILTGASANSILDRFGWFAWPLMILGAGGILIGGASASCGWRYWPRWAVPPHQRDQPSPRQERKASDRVEREARHRKER